MLFRVSNGYQTMPMNLSKNDLKPVREGRKRADVKYVARSLIRYARP